MSEAQLTLNDPIGSPNYQTVGFSGYLSNEVGSEVEVHNPGASTIGIHCHIPSGAKINFSGSFHSNFHWEDITLRSIEGDGYTNFTTGHSDNKRGESFIGSIAGLDRIKFTITQSGFSDGFVAGNMSKEVGTLEGIENNAPPHKYGHTSWNAGIQFSGAATGNHAIYTPPTDRKFVVTDISLSYFSNAGSYITFYENGNASDEDSWIWTNYAKTNQNNPLNQSMGYVSPYVATGLNNSLNLATTDECTIRGTIHGYFI